MVSNDSDGRTVNKDDDKCIGAFQMWCYQRIIRTKFTENASEAHVLENITE